jgi:hypothetical protein
MGGEHRRDPQPLEDLVEVGVRPVTSSQPGDSLCDGVIEQPITRGTFAAAQRADPGARLGEVHELEVQRERR